MANNFYILNRLRTMNCTRIKLLWAMNKNEGDTRYYCVGFNFPDSLENSTRKNRLKNDLNVFFNFKENILYKDLKIAELVFKKNGYNFEQSHDNFFDTDWVAVEILMRNDKEIEKFNQIINSRHLMLEKINQIDPIINTY